MNKRKFENLLRLGFTAIAQTDWSDEPLPALAKKATELSTQTNGFGVSHWIAAYKEYVAEFPSGYQNQQSHYQKFGKR